MIEEMRERESKEEEWKEIDENLREREGGKSA